MERQARAGTRETKYSTPQPAFRIRPLAHAVLCATLGASLAGGPGPARADEPTAAVREAQHRFDVSAGMLDRTLTRLGQRAGVTISADSQLTTNLEAPAIRGEYTLAEALERALAETPLAWRTTDEGVVVTEAGDQTLEAIEVQAPRGAPGPGSDPESGYRADFSSTVTRNPIARWETPASVGVVTRDFIRDTGADSRDEALEQVAGVVRNQNNFGNQEVTIRGFKINDEVQELNGLSMRSGRPLDTAVLERIDVARGPASIVNGSGEPGGTFNVMTKRPQPEAFAELEQQAGSYGLARSVADLNAPLTADKDVRARLAASFTPDDGNFIDNTESSEMTVAPSIEADTFDGAGTLRFTFIHQDFDGTTYRGIPTFANGDVPDIDPETNIGGGDRNGAFNKFEGNTAQLEYNHEFLDRLSLTARAGYNESETDIADVYAFSYTGIAPNGDVNIYASRRDRDKESLAGELFVTGRLGSRDSGTDITVGVDYVDQEEQESYDFASGGTDNVFDPQNDFAVPASGLTPFVDDRLEVEQTGVFAQVVSRPLPGLTITGGARRDMNDVRNEDRISGTVSGGDVDDADTFRMGASYELFPRFNVYATYQESFDVQAQTAADGSLVPPETGENVEGGFKWDFAENLSLAFAVFETDRENVAFQDPDNPRFFTTSGLQRHEGVELELNGEVTESLRISAQVSYVDAEIIDDPTPENVGATPSGVPVDPVARLFAVYGPSSGRLAGWELGGGVLAHSGFSLDQGSGLESDSFERVDLMAARNLDEQWRFQFNIRNLLDEEYVESPGFTTGSNQFGSPRAVTGRVSYRF